MKTDKIRIHDWDQWQSYRNDRGLPPWIKIHRCLMRDAKWVSLGSHERGDLVSLWLLAADNDGWIPNDIALIQKLCYMDNPPNINKFIDLGLLDATARQDDANVTPERRQRDAPEAEAEAEADTEEEEEKKDSLSVSEKNGRHEYPPAFEEFWKPIVAKQVFYKTPPGVKGEARKEWDKVRVSSDTLLESWCQYVSQCRATDTHSKHVCRWLKYRGWEQEYAMVIPMGKKVDLVLAEKYRREDEERERNAVKQISD